jgi:predicted permease
VSALLDLKYSARSFARTPALTIGLVLTIAAGIGSNAIVLGFIRGLVTRDVPMPGIETVASVFARDEQGAFGPLSLDDLPALRAQAPAFESLGAARESQSSAEIGGRSFVAAVAAITPELFDLLHLSPQGGVIVSQRIWRNELGSRKDVSEAPIRIDGVEARIAGVAPEWLDGLYVGRDVDLWTPLDDASLTAAERRSRTLWVLARLRPGVPASRAQAVVNAARGTGAVAVAVQPYTGMTPEVAGGLSRINRLLPAAAGAVFFIACANVAAFLLARSSARSQETSVRVALGASRRQLARQLLTDSVLVSVAGGAVGVLLAVWTAGIIPALFFDQDAEHLSFVPDVGAIVLAAVACGVVTIACGLVPFVELKHDDPAAILRREAGGPSNAMRRLRTGLVVAQMACCCLLVVSTGLLISGFRAALRTSAGERLGQPILAAVEAGLRFARPDLGLEFFRGVERTAQSLPGITSVAWTGTMPASRPAWSPVRIEPSNQPMHDVTIELAPFTPQTVSGLVLPPLAGRLFGGADTPGSCPVAVVNEQAADQVFGNDAVGRSISEPSGDRVEIVGVVGTKRRPDAPAPRPMIYYYADQISIAAERVGQAQFRVPDRSPAARAMLAAVTVSASYFDAMGLTPVDGRIFDDRPQPPGCRVAVVDQQAAELYFDGHATGGAVIDAAGHRTEIIGVVRSPLLHAAQRQGPPSIYLPYWQDFQPRMTLILGARAADETLLTTVRRSLSGVPGGAVLRVTTLEEHLGRTALAPERIATTLVAASAALALGLGVLGMYGAMAESNRQRRREIALRIALGAQSWRVIRQVLVEGLQLAGIGAAAGAIASLAVARWLTRITPSVGVPSVSVWIAAPLALVAAVVVASVLPARRALATSPLTIMRE